MRAKRRCMHGKRLRRSPLRDYPTRDFSPEATKGNIGDKIATSLKGDTSSVTGFVSSAIPIGKVGKWAKTAYNYFMPPKETEV